MLATLFDHGFRCKVDPPTERLSCDIPGWTRSMGRYSWWELKFSAYCDRGLEWSHERVGMAIHRVVSPSGGWMCGYVPKYESSRGETRMLGFNFTIIWPKFL